jgi:hypothetical protein
VPSERRRARPRANLRLALLCASVALGSAFVPAARQVVPSAAQVPADLRPLLTPRPSEMRLVVQRYELDRQRLDDNYAGARPEARGRQGGAPRSSPPRVPVSEARLTRLREFELNWQRAVEPLDTSAWSAAGRADAKALLADIAANLSALDDRRRTLAALDEVVTFRRNLVGLVEARSPALAAYGAEAVALLRRDLDEWFRFYDGYDPLFCGGCGSPMPTSRRRSATAKRGSPPRAGRPRGAPTRRDERRRRTLPRREPIGAGLPSPLAARGREGLIRDLQDEMIPYTAEELLALAEREFAWVELEMRHASNDLGFGDDWKAAIEHAKSLHPPPGGQPAVIQQMLAEAVDYLRTNNLVTVPAVAAESMHINMLTPEEQLINPFFRGGPLISLSYPTDTMTFDQRLQSMRGNNTPFSHATAHHEMIPGHYLDLFYAARYAGVRADLRAATPFFREGWALYWELQLYDRGFHDTPEERVGALFWLVHRCARILFSLNFHLGRWSPQEAIDFLVDRVGHEPDNAAAEIRRSFGGTYPPLYQAAYLLGGIQIRSMYRELVESGRLTPRAFHDGILRQGSMPIALLRLAVSDLPLSRDMDLDWRFYGDLTGGS